MAKKRKCSDFNHELEYPYQCKYFIGEDDTKRCVFINNQCEEQFINCEDYNENVQPNICESIQPYNDIEESIDYIKNVFIIMGIVKKSPEIVMILGLKKKTNIFVISYLQLMNQKNVFIVMEIALKIIKIVKIMRITMKKLVNLLNLMIGKKNVL